METWIEKLNKQTAERLAFKQGTSVENLIDSKIKKVELKEFKRRLWIKNQRRVTNSMIKAWNGTRKLNESYKNTVGYGCKDLF